MQRWPKPIVFQAIAHVLLSATSFAITADGFITHSGSIMSFDIATWHFKLDSQTRCVSETYSADLYKPWSGHVSYAQPFLRSNNKSTSAVPTSCNALHLTIGSRVRITGKLYGADKILARTIVRYSGVSKAKLRSAAITEEKPESRIGDDSQHSILWIDGYPIAKAPNTTIIAVPANTSIGYRNAINLNHAYLTVSQVSAPASTALPSRYMPQENNYVVYHANRNQDGSIDATKLRLWPNYCDEKQMNFSRKFTPQGFPFSSRRPLNLKFSAAWIDGIRLARMTVKVVPSDASQEFVSEVGLGIVPQFQRDLPDKDATKIHFYFVVTKPIKCCNARIYVNDGGEQNIDDDAIIAFPNGLILVPDIALVRLQTRAQLAALLSYAVTAVIQKQSFIAWPFINKAARIDGNPSVIRTVSFFRNQQVLRIGIRQMYLAGYDIREAPYAWAVAQGRPVANPLINSKHPDREIPWYAAYAFNYISQYYKDVDYSKLKRGRAEYQQFLEELYKADPTLKRPTAQTVKQ